MSCSVPTRSYYSNKINIYDNDSFIPLPNWKSCPPPSQIYILPELVYPPAGPYMPPVIVPLQAPLYYAGEYCGNKRTPSGCGNTPSATPCGPCGSAPSATPCGPCGR